MFNYLSCVSTCCEKQNPSFHCVFGCCMFLTNQTNPAKFIPMVISTFWRKHLVVGIHKKAIAIGWGTVPGRRVYMNKYNCTLFNIMFENRKPRWRCNRVTSWAGPEYCMPIVFYHLLFILHATEGNEIANYIYNSRIYTYIYDFRVSETRAVLWQTCVLFLYVERTFD